MELIWGYTVNRLMQWGWVNEKHELPAETPPSSTFCLLLWYPNKNIVTGNPSQPRLYLDSHNPDCIGYVGRNYARILADASGSQYNMLKSMYHVIERRYLCKL